LRFELLDEACILKDFIENSDDNNEQTNDKEVEERKPDGD